LIGSNENPPKLELNISLFWGCDLTSGAFIGTTDTKSS
jgi:hypothetical protein